MSRGGLVPFFHRQVWQRLPRGLRRGALFAWMRWRAPRPTTAYDDKGPVVVAGTFRAATGLGESARLCYRALVANGFDVRAIDLTEALLQPLDLPFEAPAGDLAGPGTIVLHVNPPLVPMAMRALGSRIIGRKRIVGYWAWELPALPRDWAGDADFVHDVWTTSAFTARAIATIVKKPIHVVWHPVAITAPPAAAAPTSGPFTVLTVFNIASSFERKNPLAAVRAFKAAFGGSDTARLVLKASNADAYPPALEALRREIGGAPNISVVSAVSGPDEMDALYRSASVVLSLHRSEGFGLIVAEAMLRGIPVVATNWSGTADFFDASVGIPVPVAMVAARDPQATYDMPWTSWAEPDVAAAAKALKALRNDPERAMSLGAAGRERALELFGPEAYAATVRAALNTAPIS